MFQKEQVSGGGGASRCSLSTKAQVGGQETLKQQCVWVRVGHPEGPDLAEQEAETWGEEGVHEQKSPVNEVGGGRPAGFQGRKTQQA